MSKIVKGNNRNFLKNLKLDKKGISFDDYGARPLIEIDPNDTMYNTFRKTVLNRPNTICVTHNNISYSYAEVLTMVDQFAASLKYRGLGKGDIIALPLEHSIQASVALMAINKIGAVSKWVDIEKSSMELLDNFKSTDTKFIIASKVVEDNINSIKKDLPYNDSVIFFDTYSDDDNFKKFLELGKGLEVENVKYDENDPAIMITSSGSTGKPKNMYHSSYSVNSAIKKLTYTDYPIKDNIMLIGIPPFIGLGLVTTLYASMICGGEAVILPEYKSPLAFVEYIRKNIKNLNSLPKNKKVLLFAAPVFFKSMYGMLDDIDDLSFIGAMVGAGNKMEKDLLIEMDKKFKSKGCNVPVCNAYGQNEHCGGISYNTISKNKEGSAGKIAYGTRVMIVDPITKEELPKNKIGKIVEQSTSQFLGYDNNKEAELASVFVDNDGEKWFDTKDLGSFDDDNYLHVFDRESRSIIRFDFKVALAAVEKKLLRHKDISDAIVVKVIVDTPFGKDQAPYAFVTLKNANKKTTSEELLSDIQKSDYPLSMLENPVCIQIIKENQVPYKNNKIDYIKLQETAQKIIGEPLNDDPKQKIKTL